MAPLLDPLGAPLAVISAPAGSGKTTLLNHVADASPWAVVWYRATEDDATERDLVKSLGQNLAAGLGLTDAERARDVGGLLDAVGPGGAVPTLLLMDDLHEISGTGAEQALERLVRHRPAHWRIVLGCRRPPVSNLSRLRLTEDVLELGGDDLRFRSWEVEELFDVVYDRPLPPESVAALTRRTAGWAAGLALFHLATTGKTSAQRRRAVDELGAGSRLLRSYLARTVLAALSEPRRYFLTRTCALGTLSGPTCDELLDTTRSLAVLEELAHDQLFTVCDDDGLTFHYHHVLQSHLEVALVEELGPQAARAWYARCAAVLEYTGAVREAMRAHARAEDWGSLGRLLQRQGLGNAGDTEPGWQDLLPTPVRARDPWFASADARRRLRHGDLLGAVAAMRHAEELSDERGFQHQCRRDRAFISAWLPGPPSATASGPGPGFARGHWSQRLRAAVQAAPERLADPLPPSATTDDRFVAGVAALLAGQAERAATHFDTCSYDPTEDTGLHLRVELGAAVAGLLSGDGRGSADRLEAVVLRAETEDHPWLARQARALADAVARRGAHRAAPPSADAVLEECERHGDAWGAALLQLVGGASGAFDDSRDAAEAATAAARLDDAAARFRRLQASVLEAWARSLRALHLARTGAAGAGDAARDAEDVARRAQVRAARSVARTAGELAAATAPGAGANACDGFPPWLASVLRRPRRVVTVAGRPPRMGLRCFGGFELRIGDEQLDLDDLRPRARALLRYLALQVGTDVHRERLVDDLWPGVALPAGVRSLQVAVSSLRHVLHRADLDAADVLRRHANAYQLSLPPGSTCDVAELERRLAIAAAARRHGDLPSAADACRSALDLYRGELLPEDGPAEWVVGERERLRLSAACGAAALARDHRDLGRLAEAVAAARRSVTLDPWCDPSWRLLTELHDAAGDHSAATRARQEHRRIARELSLPAPSEPDRARRDGPKRPLTPAAPTGPLAPHPATAT